MTKRLQVLLDDDELAEIREFARGRRVTVAAWVRGVLRAARSEASASPQRKLAALRRATTHAYPTGDIDQMLAEIETGYMGATRSPRT